MGIKSCAIADLDFAFTQARKGDCLLPEKCEEMKIILSSLKEIHKFHLDENGIPKNQKDSEWSAADAWALAGKDSKGKDIINSVHSQLKQKGVWIWPVGCIEQITKHQKKGEKAIINQEELLRNMDKIQFENDMPLFKECFDWIKNF